MALSNWTSQGQKTSSGDSQGGQFTGQAWDWTTQALVSALLGVGRQPQHLGAQEMGEGSGPGWKVPDTSPPKPSLNKCVIQKKSLAKRLLVIEINRRPASAEPKKIQEYAYALWLEAGRRMKLQGGREIKG